MIKTLDRKVFVMSFEDTSTDHYYPLIMYIDEI